MTAPVQDHPDRRWSVTEDDQFVALDGQPVAMADTPQRARQIVELLNAQDAGALAVESHWLQRLNDLRNELHRHLRVQERRADRAEAEVERLRAALAECSKLADFWDRQAADHAHDYDRFIVSENDEIRMQGRRVQGKAESYTEAARALRVALAAKAGAE